MPEPLADRFTPPREATLRRSGGDRRHPTYVAFVIHRVSGLLLALFLPLHFWALGQAISGEAALEGFLRWTDNALFKFAEWGLVVLLAVHLAGGLRVMALEFLGWRARQKDMVAASAGVAIAAAILFLLNVG
ncbi:succinate dehydrogenase, cytochrome b556 subunit [Roseococcus sp. SDR]|uniref:succinate dehydrogenase, cytochrome b556 subunit n=1 Tax=Roseococcus sp. SDR TaxID=2835532 RepID=UPI001BCEA55E|nr:succinate dehydrogenase, cytochrome b556 subunit [Roseococcus sp. SDR]MBS7792026.1 succinate dehydrogenase, cytochrome b556 subunit [Roseococcus sp. SDR]MBV1847340.1 succinate dehydrogenase, cytochrome b556 subunit [Roseococcus sp. SDR]